MASILIGFEYIHNQGIIHRDIKPENLVFEKNGILDWESYSFLFVSIGYLRITDFGIARMWRPDNSADTSGTPGYMAPEVMCRQNHGVAVDYYALGVMAYECMIGKVILLTKIIVIISNSRDRILEEIEKKLETKFWQNKFKSKEMKFLKAGL